MNYSTIWLFLILFLLILASAFFSASETSMIAISRYRLRHLVNSGNKRAKRTEKLLQDTDSLIGTILLGNNFVNIFAATIATIIAIKLFGESAVFIASIILTITILVFAETTPKTFAAKSPEKVAFFSAPVINLFIILFKPLVWVIKTISNTIFRVLRIQIPHNRNRLSSEELRMSVLDAKTSIADNYHAILLNILALEKVGVEDIMIVKAELIAINIDDEQETLRVLQTAQHTRILVYQGNKDNIIGILHMRDVANLYAKNNFTFANLKALVYDTYFIPEGITLSQQLEQFKKQKHRIGLVVDEYGEVKGMIALDDILEEIVGQFTSNPSDKIQDFNQQADGSYLLNPSINLYKLGHHLNIKFDTNARTLNGLILDKLQTVPQRGVSVKINNIVIEIIQIVDNNIKLVKLTII